ncbi:DivIVA domain-containing protein [Allofustis seminis]|uniref:DivIVA domain-containing protein n=1 Tax=Allofustis seminis TaxID=166939 RepID=UPI00037E44E7|nr:DivIVA domain-containing protein [Allofustis seminis]
MTLTPMDIHNKEFSTKMRGYHPDEVNEFLDQIIKEFEHLLRNKRILEDELNIAREKLANYDDMQDALNKSIIVAQEAADRLKENTDKEIEVVKREATNYADDVRSEADKYSQTIREDAEAHADELLQEAVIKARKIEEETEQLRKHNRIFRQRLQLLIESQLELIKKNEWDEVLQGEKIEEPQTQTIEEVEKTLGFAEALEPEEFDEDFEEATEEEADEEVVDYEDDHEDATEEAVADPSDE